MQQGISDLYGGESKKVTGNYSMPDPIKTDCGRIEYWFADSEQKARRWDIAYIKKHFPQTTFRRTKGVGHGGLASLYPEKLAKGIKSVCGQPWISGQ